MSTNAANRNAINKSSKWKDPSHAINMNSCVYRIPCNSRNKYYFAWTGESSAKRIYRHKFYNKPEIRVTLFHFMCETKIMLENTAFIKEY